MAKKRTKKATKPATINPEDVLNEYELNPKQELFCIYYTSPGDTFSNATMSYAEAYEYELERLSTWAAKDEHQSEYDRQCNVCAANGNRLLRNSKVRARLNVLLNQLLKNEVVDGELAKLIQQDNDFATKIKSIAEYNKLRGRIIDKTQQIGGLPLGETDIAVLIATLPQERQDHFYAVIKQIIDEATQLRGSASEG